MGYIPLLLMSSLLLLVPGNTLDFTDSISLYIFFGLRDDKVIWDESILAEYTLSLFNI